MPNYAPLKFVDSDGKVWEIAPTGYPPASTGGGGGTTPPAEGSADGDERGVGYHIPPGSLDILKAALVNHATARVEIAYFGDSTGYGSGPDLLGGPPRKLRAILLDAGLTDGGQGSVWSYTDQMSTTFTEAGHVYTFPPNGGWNSMTAGETITFTGSGTAMRIVGWSIKKLSYVLDGGPPTPITTTTGNSPTNGVDYLYISGLSAGNHTITLTNTVTGSGGTEVIVEWLNNVGVVVHQDSVSGGTSTNYTSYKEAMQSGTLGNNPAQYGLGLKFVANGTNNATPSDPNGRNVKAAIWALGINDMLVTTDADPDTNGAKAAGVLAENFTTFIRMCNTGGITPILAVPHFAADPRGYLSGGRHQQALVTVAEAHGVAWCDYNVARKLAGYTTIANDPHRPQVEYDAEAQFLFDTIISKALPAGAS